MLNYIAIKQAIENANNEMFSDKEASKLCMSSNKSISLDPKTDSTAFLETWLGELYRERINPKLPDNPTDKTRKRAIKDIMNAERIEAYDLFWLCELLGKDLAQIKTNVYVETKESGSTTTSVVKKENTPELEKVVLSLSNNIKTVIARHCTARGQHSAASYDQFARKVVAEIITQSAKGKEDTVRDLFSWKEISDEDDYVYIKLAAFSLIALTPRTKKQTEKEYIEKFCAAFNSYFSKYFFAGSKPSERKSASGSTIDNSTIKGAWKSWYQDKKEKNRTDSVLLSEGGIKREILPLVDSMQTDVHKENCTNHPLMEIVKSTSDHLCIIGEGGIGKTTFLYSIMEDAYDNDDPVNGQIPMYVELSKASKKDMKDGESRYIRNTLYDLIQKEVRKRAEDSSMRRSDLETAVDDLFSKTTDSHEYVLLLDGLNEVSRECVEDSHTVVGILKSEISFIVRTYSNVRVILTSRSKEDDVLKSGFSLLKLSGIGTDRIEEYLSSHFSEERLKSTLKNRQLMGVLRIPLFLTMYARLKGDDELLSKGEILNTFFTQKRNDLLLYTERSRADAIERDLRRTRGINKSDASVTEIMLGFMLDFILPSIAWYMVSNGNKFRITLSEIEEYDLIREVLERRDDTSVCGRYGQKCFSDYIVETDDFLIDVREVARRITVSFGKGADEDDEERKWKLITRKVCTFLSQHLGVMEKTSGRNGAEYQIVHQHIRDYFAALYHINRLRLAVYLKDEMGMDDLARTCLAEWGEIQISGQVLTFVGEALKEKHNVPVFDPSFSCDEDAWEKNTLDPRKDKSDRTLVTRAFELFRDRLEMDEEDGYSVWNLLQILKLVRKDLSNVDLSYLDLTKCHVNGYRLGNRSFAADLKGSLLNDSFFLPSGHVEHINYASYSGDGRYVVTASDDKTAKIMDAHTCEIVATLVGHSKRVNTAEFCKEKVGDFYTLLTASEDGTCNVYFWTAAFAELSLERHPVETIQVSSQSINDAQFNNDGSIIVAATDDGVKLYARQEDKYSECTVPDGHTAPVNSARFDRQGQFVVTASDDATVRIYQVIMKRSSVEVAEYKSLELDGPVQLAQFGQDDDGKYIVTVSDSGVNVWDTQTWEKIEQEISEGSSGSVKYAEFSPAGRYLLTAEDKSIKCMDFKNRIVLRKTDGNQKYLSASYSPDGKYIVATTWREITLLDAETLNEVPGGKMKANFSDVFSAMFSPQGDRIVLACREGTAKVFNWDEDTGVAVEVSEGLLKGHDGYSVYSAQFSLPDANYITTASGDGTCKIWDARTFKEISGGTLIGHSGKCFTAQYLEKENLVLTAEEKAAHIWEKSSKDDHADWVKRAEIKGHSRSLNMAEFSSDGKQIITCASDKTARLYNAKSYKPVRKQGKEVKLISPNIMESAKFSPKEDGIKRILTADHRGHIQLWDAASYEEVPEIDIKCTNRCYASFSPDEKKIVVASWDGYAKVAEWNEKKHVFEEVATLMIPDECPGEVSTAVFSPPTKRCPEGGRFILTSSWDNTARVWDACSYELVSTIHSRSGFEVWGVDLTETSGLSKNAMEILQEYGAKVNSALLKSADRPKERSKRLRMEHNR